MSNDPDLAGVTFAVSFDADLNIDASGMVHPTTTYPVENWATMPAFYQGGPGHRDAGVVLLGENQQHESVPSTVPEVQLPEPSSADALRGEVLTSVGCGVNSLDRSSFSKNMTLSGEGKRVTGTERVHAVATPWLKTTADPSASCQGDSGGPQFFEDVQVSITIAGDPVCHTVNQDQRLDLPDVLDWLANPAPLAQ